MRISACFALFIAGCGSSESAPVGVQTSALDSCNLDGDCPLPATHGTCVKTHCNNHACEYVMDDTACPTGCTVGTQAVDCNLGATNCFIVKCKAGVCDFSDYSAGSGCQCTAQPPMPGECTAANGCQNAPTCNSATCTYTAKQPLAQPCCNVVGDCGGTAVCAANTCGCVSGSDKYCNGTMAGNGRCVPTAGCCVPADCAAGNGCQARTCSVAGACGFQSNGNSGCCNTAVADCGGTATCVANTCTCGAGEKFCPGSSPGNGSCIANSACCVNTDCAARANATVACNGSHACVYTCNSTFHDCSGVCKADNSVATCGSMCTACPAGNSCQTPACTSGSCGFVAAGASPCCNATGDCTPANACQMATACTANRCVFGSTGAGGCCNSPSDCPTPSDPCLAATCVANQCAEAPITGCTDDLAEPIVDDLSVAVTPDLSASVSISGGGGCALAAHARSSPAALVVVALFLVALARRRRAA